MALTHVYTKPTYLPFLIFLMKTQGKAKSSLRKLLLAVGFPRDVFAYLLVFSVEVFEGRNRKGTGISGGLWEQDGVDW